MWDHLWVSKARNTGLRYSNGDFIAFLNSDDEWYQDKIEKQIDLFNKKPEIDPLGCAFNGLYIEKLPAGKLLKIDVNRLIYKNFFQPSTVIMKKSVLDENGYYMDTDVGYMRIIFANGLVGLFLFYLTHYYLLSRINQFNLFVKFVILCALITLHSKVIGSFVPFLSLLFFAALIDNKRLYKGG